MDEPQLVIERHLITGIVLAGGQGRRMGGLDKGLQLYRGQPLAQHALQRLQSQVGILMVNANQHIDQYAAFKVPVVLDSMPGSLPHHAGPLAGFLSGLAHARTPYLATVPCDAPAFPLDLVSCLAMALVDSGADVAVAEVQADDVVHLHPVFCLMRITVQPALAAFVNDGGRQVQAWVASCRHTRVRFEQATDFANLNTLAELDRAEHGNLT